MSSYLKVLLFLLLASFSLPTFSQEDDDEDFISEVVYQVSLGEIALQRKEYKLAASLYADLALKSGDVKAFDRAVEVTIFAKEYTLADRVLQRWMVQAPSEKRPLQLRIGLLLLTERFDEMSDEIAALLKSDPEGRAHHLLGFPRMFSQMEDKARVLRIVEALTKPYLDLPEAHLVLALAAHAAKRPVEARLAAQEALARRPDWEAAALVVGELLLAAEPRDLEAAIRFLSTYHKAHPTAQDISFLLAKSLLAAQRSAEAEALFVHLLTEQPKNPEILYALALLRIQKNEAEAAEPLLLDITKIAPQNASSAWYYLAGIAEAKGNRDLALARYAEVTDGETRLLALITRANLLVDKSPLHKEEALALLKNAKTDKEGEEIALRLGQSSILRRTGDQNRAFSVLETALKKHPKNASLLYEFALVAEAIGKIEVAEGTLQKLIAQEPDNAQAHNALGYLLVERNLNLSQARIHLEKALSLLPSDSAILDSMGWLLFKEGQKEAALIYLSRAYEARPEAEIASHLVEVLWGLGRKEDALRLLNQAIEKAPSDDTLKKMKEKIGAK